MMRVCPNCKTENSLPTEGDPSNMPRPVCSKCREDLFPQIANSNRPKISPLDSYNEFFEKLTKQIVKLSDKVRTILKTDIENIPWFDNLSSLRGPKTIKYALIIVGIILFLQIESGSLFSGSTNYQVTKPIPVLVSQKSIILREADYKSGFQSLSLSERRRFQYWLKLGYGYNASIDGVWGANTATAMRRAVNKHKNNYKGNNAGQIVNQTLRKGLSKVPTVPRTGPTVAQQQSVRMQALERARMGFCIAAGNSPRASQNLASCLASNGNTVYQAPQPIFAQPSNPTTFLKNQYTSGGNTMCRYNDGSVDNIGVGLCPLSK